MSKKAVHKSDIGGSHTMARLQIKQGESSGAIYPLYHTRTVIGRLDSAHLQLKDGRISRVHAQILAKDGLFWIEDLNSRGGTWLNGKKIEELMRLRSGDSIRLGKIELVFIL